MTVFRSNYSQEVEESLDEKCEFAINILIQNNGIPVDSPMLTFEEAACFANLQTPEKLQWYIDLELGPDFVTLQNQKMFSLQVVYEWLTTRESGELRRLHKRLWRYRYPKAP